MISLNEYIKESIKVVKASPFKESVSFEMSKWDEWKSDTSNNQQILVYEDIENGICNIYINQKHVGMYKIDDQILFYDDPKIFNIEK